TIIEDSWFTAKGIFGIFAANSILDDIEVYNEKGQILSVSRTLRQQAKKAAGISNLALSDFIAPKDSGLEDYVGCFCVTVGFGVEEKAKEFESQHDDYNAIMIKALADRLAEVYAEYLHQEVRRKYWAYASDENLSLE